MGELSFETTKEKQDGETVKTNTPLTIALACALLLVAIFVAAMEAEGQSLNAQKQIEFGSISGRVIAPLTDAGIPDTRVMVNRVHARADANRTSKAELSAPKK